MRNLYTILLILIPGLHFGQIHLESIHIGDGLTYTLPIGEVPDTIFNTLRLRAGNNAHILAAFKINSRWSISTGIRRYQSEYGGYLDSLLFESDITSGTISIVETSRKYDYWGLPVWLNYKLGNDQYICDLVLGTNISSQYAVTRSKGIQGAAILEKVLWKKESTSNGINISLTTGIRMGIVLKKRFGISLFPMVDLNLLKKEDFLTYKKGRIITSGILLEGTYYFLR